jgi:hypothetical protein
MSKAKQRKPTTIKKWASAMLELFGPDGKHWAKNDFAYRRIRGGRSQSVDWSEYQVEPKDERAASWCMIGAIKKLGIPDDEWLNRHLAIASEELEKQNGNLIYGRTADFNDDDGWKPVKALLTQLAEHGKVVNPEALIAN